MIPLLRLLLGAGGRERIGPELEETGKTACPTLQSEQSASRGTGGFACPPVFSTLPVTRFLHRNAGYNGK